MGGNEARGFAAVLIAVAVALIAVGRLNVRRARRLDSGPAWRRRKAAFGWMLVAVGVVLMTAGVVLW